MNEVEAAIPSPLFIDHGGATTDLGCQYILLDRFEHRPIDRRALVESFGTRWCDPSDVNGLGSRCTFEFHCRFTINHDNVEQILTTTGPHHLACIASRSKYGDYASIRGPMSSRKGFCGSFEKEDGSIMMLLKPGRPSQVEAMTLDEEMIQMDNTMVDTWITALLKSD